MSTMDQPRSLSPRWSDVITQPRSQGAALAASAVAYCRERAAALRANRPLRVAIVWAAVAWLVLEITFIAWVHLSLEGASHRAFLPGTWFGIPAREAAAGMQCVSRFGYDGQLYYWQSNDIFGRHDAYKHIDNVMYRYQRIGMPMLAGGVATLFGFPLTPPLLYHTLNFGLTAVGFGALVYWLLIKGLHPAYALGWLLAVGTIESLWKGLLDAPADAVFALAMIAALSGRLRWYVPLAAFLLLVREVYAVFACPIFVLTLLGRIEWQDVQGYWKRAFLTAVPGGVMLAWTAYLTINFQLSPIKGHTDNPAVTSYPFYMMFKYLGIFAKQMNWSEFRLALVPAFTLLLVTMLLVRNFRKLPWPVLATIPFVLMTASLGMAVWEGYGASTRVTGTLLVVGLMIMPFDGSILLRFLLALQAIVGIAWESDIRFLHPALYSPHLLHEESWPAINPPGSPENPLLNDLRCQVEWLEPEATCRRNYHGVWDWVHREIKPVKVAVTNRSDVFWYGGRGKHPIWVGCTVIDPSGQRAPRRRVAIIDRSIAPGQTEEFTAYLELTRPGTYQVEFSLMQEGAGWFADTDPAFGRRYEVQVE
ncbi:MAG TPA: hypothetical protein VL175_16540 [Pirellulales bacterium]|jgi:hypothetical protein|nr:hypothetical protein [Pirellulales bacterium]